MFFMGHEQVSEFSYFYISYFLCGNLLRDIFKQRLNTLDIKSSNLL